MKGLLRGAGNEDDPYRFAAQMGYAWLQRGLGRSANWTEMNLGPIGKRTKPGPVAEYKMKFVAPANDMTLFIRGWKKWGIPNVEMDFNIDAVSVKGCGVGPMPNTPVVAPVAASCVGPCGRPVADRTLPVGPVVPVGYEVPVVALLRLQRTGRWTQATATNHRQLILAMATSSTGRPAMAMHHTPVDSWLRRMHLRGAARRLLLLDRQGNGTTVRELQPLNGLAIPTSSTWGRS